MPMDGPHILTSDAAGNAAFVTEYLEGRLQHIYIDYGVATPATTDVTITDDMTTAQFLQVLNNNTPTDYFPRALCVDNTGALIFYDLTAPAPGAVNQGEVRDCFYLSGAVNIAVAGMGIAGRTVTLYIFYSEFR